jgi:hypothetical protein
MDDIPEIDENLKKHSQWYPTDADGNIVYNSQAQGYGTVDYGPPITMDGKRGSLTRIKEKVYNLEEKKEDGKTKYYIGKEAYPCEKCGQDQESAVARASHERLRVCYGKGQS